MLILGLVLWAVDVHGKAGPLTFFNVFGRNPLQAYITSEVGTSSCGRPADGRPQAAFEWLYRHAALPIAGDTAAGSFLFAIGFMLEHWLLAWACCRRGVLIKVQTTLTHFPRGPRRCAAACPPRSSDRRRAVLPSWPGEADVRRASLAAGFLVPAFVLAGQLALKDDPTRGEWRFSPEKLWQIHKAGDADLGRIAELLVSDNEHVCVRDFARNVSYLFDRDGKYIRAFAPQGNEAGQLPRYLNRFRAGSHIVLAAPDRLHFFTEDGVYERAVENDLFVRFPLWFMSEREFIYAPNLPQSPVHDTKLISVDLASGTERTLLEFSGAAGSAARDVRGPMLMIPTLTPQVKLAYDRGTMAFARNDDYRIHVADRAGRIRSAFRLDRRGTPVTLEDKQRLLAGAKLPEAQRAQFIAQLPDETTFFSQLLLVDGFIYVFAVTAPANRIGAQRVDIFSASGEYLYRGTLEFGGELTFAGASDIILKGPHAYVILENRQGVRTLAKYRVSMPPDGF
jgi:hypothetical protein